MTSTVISRECKIQRCKHGGIFLDPCDENYYYVCDNSKYTRSLCARGTHFVNEKVVCDHTNRTTSGKENFWKACNNNTTSEQCRKNWPEDAKLWSKTKFLDPQHNNPSSTASPHTDSSNNSTTPSPSPQTKNLLVPLIVISLFLLCLSIVIIIIIIAWNRRRKSKQTQPGVSNNNSIESENEDPVYAVIDESKIRTAFPSRVNGGPEHGLDISRDSPNQKNIYDYACITQDSFIDLDNQEGEYNVLDIVGIEQNTKSSEMSPEGYSSLDFNNAEDPNDPTYEIPP